MSVDDVDRKLVAIMAADMVGFTRLLGLDEAGTLSRLGAARRDIIDPAIRRSHGRIFKLVGDGILAEFPSAVLALRCAVAIQTQLHEQDEGVGETHRVVFRIGVHQGEVVIDRDDLIGDGVNVAARLERMAEPGGVCISGRVQEDAAGKIAVALDDLGEHRLRNIDRAVRVLQVRLPWQAAGVEDDADRTFMRIEPRPAGHVLIPGAGSVMRHVVPIIGALTIGRTVPCDLILPDREVSRQHCRIELRPPTAWINDLGSSNGTFVDGRRVTAAPTALAHGARITIGTQSLIYERTDMSDATMTRKVPMIKAGSGG